MLYDSEKIKKMFKHYNDICKKNRVIPRRILLSFAPVSSKKNIEFVITDHHIPEKSTYKYPIINPVFENIRTKYFYNIKPIFLQGPFLISLSA